MPSAFSAEEFGESSQPSALPWDMIPATAYLTTQHVASAQLSKLQASFTTRLKTKPDLIKLREDFDRWKKIKDANSISLNLIKRKKELDDQKKKPDESQAVIDALAGSVDAATDVTKKEKAAGDKHAKDAYLKETQQIVADWIRSSVAKK